MEFSKLLQLMLVMAGLYTAESIQCFQCSSQKDPGCAELSEIYAITNDTELTPAMFKLREDTMKYLRECEGEVVGNNRTYFCRKISQTIFARDRLELVIRSCGWEVYPHRECYEFENKGHAETVCQCFDDGCNQAPSLSGTQVFMVLTLLTVLLVC